MRSLPPPLLLQTLVSSLQRSIVYSMLRTVVLSNVLPVLPVLSVLSAGLPLLPDVLSVLPLALPVLPTKAFNAYCIASTTCCTVLHVKSVPIVLGDFKSAHLKAHGVRVRAFSTPG